MLDFTTLENTLVMLYSGTFIPSRNAKDFNQLRCQEKQMLKLADLIKAALNEVGCEELPSGCDDLSVDQSFIENNISNGEQPVRVPLSPDGNIPTFFPFQSNLMFSFFHLKFGSNDLNYKCFIHIVSS